MTKIIKTLSVVVLVLTLLGCSDSNATESVGGEESTNHVEHEIRHIAIDEETGCEYVSLKRHQSGGLSPRYMLDVDGELTIKGCK